MSDDLQDVLRKLVPIIGEDAVKRAWESLQLADAKTARLIEFSLRRRLVEATGSPFGEEALLLPLIPPDKSGGSLRLGHVMYGRERQHEFGLRPTELLQHLAIFGRSGAGKTNICFLLLRELARANVPFLVFDWKKNYRDLLRVRGFEKLAIYTVGRDDAPFYFNPLIPPAGVHPQEWLKKLIEIMGHAYYLGEGVAFVLQEVMDQIYRERGIYDGTSDWPTMRDVFAALRARPVKGREAQWSESALRALGVLNFGAMDAVLNTGMHFPVELLLQQEAVLELDGLVHDDKVFLIETLLLWIHHHRMREPGRETLKHVLVVEEAHHIVLRKQQELLGNESVVDVILREIRELGEGIVLLDQLPSLVSRPALENSYMTLACNLKEQGDVTSAAKAMLLDAKEARHLGRLPVGWAIAKLQARWTKPFLLHFPLLLLRKGVVTDEEVSQRLKKSLTPETIARMMKQAVDAFVQLAYYTIPELSLARAGPATPELAVELAPEERALLLDVAQFPASSVTERYRRLGLTSDKGTELVERLIKRGLLTATSIPIPGSHVRVLRALQQARDALGLARESDRLGGPAHLYWAERLRAEVTGDERQREAPVGEGRTVDLLVTFGKHRIAIEIETGNADWKANVRKCLNAGLDEVIVAPTREELVDPMAEEVRNEGWTKVTVVPVWNVATYLVTSRARGKDGNAGFGDGKGDSGGFGNGEADSGDSAGR